MSDSSVIKLNVLMEIEIPIDDSLWEDFSIQGDYTGDIHCHAMQELMNRLLGNHWRQRVVVRAAQTDTGIEVYGPAYPFKAILEIGNEETDAG